MGELKIMFYDGLSTRGYKGKPQFKRSDRSLNAPKATSIPKIPSYGVCFGGILELGDKTWDQSASDKDKKIGRLIKRPR
jgi:hypothetical protein